MSEATFPTLERLAAHLRATPRKRTLLFGFNGTGKTRLSMAFKNGHPTALPPQRDDTLYLNAYTEDLFYWENHACGSGPHRLRFAPTSRFLSALLAPEMERPIRALLHRYAGFDFSIDAGQGVILFSHKGNGPGPRLRRASRSPEGSRTSSYGAAFWPRPSAC